MKDPAFADCPEMDIRLGCKDICQHIRHPRPYAKGAVPALKRAQEKKAFANTVNGVKKATPEMHREKEGERGDWFGHSFWSLVSRDITRAQAKHIPRAQEALDKEWEELRKARTWLEDQMMDRREVKRRARESGITCHFG